LGQWVSQQRHCRKKLDAGKPCKGITADRIKRLDDIGFNWDGSRRSVVIQPNMSLGLIVTNRYVDQSRRLVVEKVNDNSILKGKVFPGDYLVDVQVDNEKAIDVKCWDVDSFNKFLEQKRGQGKTLDFDAPNPNSNYGCDLPLFSQNVKRVFLFCCKENIIC
jgi:hypothetical protein